MNRQEFIKRAVKGSAALALLGTSCFKKDNLKKTNIIFILADDLGYGDLSCYGQSKFNTPNIDRLAVEGMRFTDHYAGSTVCAPSRCSLMTGLHTGHAYIRGNSANGKRISLRPQDLTVAEILKQAKYTTGVIGKWGLGLNGTTGHPNKKGFDYWFGYLNQRHAHNYYPEFLWKNEERYSLNGNKLTKPSADGSGISIKKIQYSHDLFTREALSFIEHNKNGPFFLYLAYTIPHANNEAGENGMEVPSDTPYSDKDWPQQQKNLAAMITRMDGDIGKIIKLLKNLGIDNNTIVFFSSDNGPHKEGGVNPNFFDSNGILRGIKRDLYEGGIRVPLIIRWPGKCKAGSISNHISAFWDFMPTAIEIAGGEVPKNIDGISFVPTLLGEEHEQQKHDFLYWEFHKKKITNQAVRMGDWKGVHHGRDMPLELYDLKMDIGETKNIAEKHPEIVFKIKEYMKTARRESEYWPLI
ncbi:MAG: arylsulfatase [bacterium]|nr:MAG: arylsulfatase [bacterium]